MLPVEQNAHEKPHEEEIEVSPVTVPELFATIAQLPPLQRASARRQVEQAIERPALEARAALALLAAELSSREAPARPGHESVDGLRHAVA